MNYNKSINQLKKEITKKYVELDNEKLIQLHKENKIEELVNSLLPLVFYVASKYKYYQYFEDLIGVGTVGLMNAIKKFDDTERATIQTFCVLNINYEILNFFEAHANTIKMPKYTKNKSEDIQSTFGKAVILDDLGNLDYYNDESTLTTINRKEIEDILLRLPNMKLSKVELFLDYFLMPNMTYQKVADKNGFTKQNASMIINTTLKKIKEDKKIYEKLKEILF